MRQAIIPTQSRFKFCCKVIVLYGFMLGIPSMGIYLIARPITVASSSALPPLVIVGFGYSTPRNLYSCSLSSQAEGASYLYNPERADAIKSLGTVRDHNLLLVPHQSASSKISEIQLWQWFPTWKKLQTRQLAARNYETFALSPNGSVFAYYYHQDKQTHLVVTNWATPKQTEICRFPQRDVPMQLECSDQGDAYITVRDAKTYKIEEIRKYSSQSEPKVVPTFNEGIVTNRKGVFGIRTTLLRAHRGFCYKTRRY